MLLTLSLASCGGDSSSSSSPSTNSSTNVDAGSDQIISEGTIANLAGEVTGISVDYYDWEIVSSSHADLVIYDSDQVYAYLLLPEVDSDTTIDFRLTVGASDGSNYSDEVTITVQDRDSQDDDEIEQETSYGSVNSDGEISINSDELRGDVLIEISDDDNNSIDSYAYQWLSLGGKLVLIAYDELGVYGPLVFQGDPFDYYDQQQVEESDVSGGTSTIRSTKYYQPVDKRLPREDIETNSQSLAEEVNPQVVDPSVVVTGTLVGIAAIKLITYALTLRTIYGYAQDIMVINNEYYHSLASVTGEVSMLRMTIGELSEFLSREFSGDLAIFSLASSIPTAGATHNTSVVKELIQTVIDAADDEVTGMLINWMNDVLTDVSLRDYNENDEVWVEIENWEQWRSRGGILVDLKVNIFTADYDDQYDNDPGNDSVSSAREILSTSENSLLVYDTDPDNYSVYLNAGDQLEITTKFPAKGRLTTQLYNPDGNSVAYGTEPSESENKLQYEASTYGNHVLQVNLDATSEWSGSIYSLDYSITSSDGSSSDSSGDLRIVLNWSDRPEDLDSHLVTPEINGETHHLYWYTADSYHVESSPYINLDVDDVDGYGPETITINQLFSGTYMYSVHEYYGSSGSLTSSDATVTIYDQFGVVEQVDVPSSGSGYWWNVFQLDGDSGVFYIDSSISSSEQW